MLGNRVNETTSPGDALSFLQLIDRLEVGPPRIEPRRVVSRYTVWKDGKADSCDLVYRFAEDVFGPPDAGALNLASLMAAQVAVNYGLLCREIVFHGSFDAVDREFLTAMAALAARDIYVRKLLRRKPFYTSWVEQIPVVCRECYLLAHLRFPEAPPDALPAWEVDAARGIACGIKNTGIGINFGTTILLGFIVGMAIAGQTFYLFTVENLRQFGALKAMGASTWTLARMILLQAFTVGLTGYGVGIGLAIPTELARPVIDSLRRGQRPQRGYLGVGLQPLDQLRLDLRPRAVHQHQPDLQRGEQVEVVHEAHETTRTVAALLDLVAAAAVEDAVAEVDARRGAALDREDLVGADAEASVAQALHLLNSQ